MEMQVFFINLKFNEKFDEKDIAIWRIYDNGDL